MRSRQDVGRSGRGQRFPLPGPLQRHLRLVEAGEKVRRAVGAPKRAPGVAFVAMSSVLLVGFLLTLVMLNVMRSQASFRLQKLEKEVAAGQVEYDRARVQMAELRSPGRITETGMQMGLVRATAARQLIVTRPESLRPIEEDGWRHDAGVKAVLARP